MQPLMCGAGVDRVASVDGQLAHSLVAEDTHGSVDRRLGWFTD